MPWSIPANHMTSHDAIRSHDHIPLVASYSVLHDVVDYILIYNAVTMLLGDPPNKMSPFAPIQPTLR